MAEDAGKAQQLPKCFCNWKNCRTYQKGLREYKHPIFNGVVKLKFYRADPKSMALKASVDRTLHVEASKRNDWKIAPANDRDRPGEEFCRYYVARHHYTEALMKHYLREPRAWDWYEPLSMMQAKDFLWSLDRLDVYQESKEDGQDQRDSEDDGDPRYVQAPNVPKDQVRDLVRRAKEEYKKAQAEAEAAAAAEQAAANEQSATSPLGKKDPSSNHTQSTLNTSVTDQFKALEDAHANGQEQVLLAQREEENLRLRRELNECQDQLAVLHDLVLQLKAETTTKKSKKKKGRKSRKEESSEEEESDDYDSSEEEDDDDDEDEDELAETWSEERGRPHASDDDETISTFHVNGPTGSGHSRSQQATAAQRSTARRTSVHSRKSMVRRESVHSRRNSVHSRSRHSVRRDSIHSRRSMRGGMDDAASVVSRQSLQSVSPSIKSLPREIELMDDEEEDTQNGKDDFSFFDDSYRKPDDDARSVGSRSAASRASRRSMVSGNRSRGRNSRRPVGPAPVANGDASDRRGASGNVPREIDLSGDELEDETYNNVSTDILPVVNRQIVDPYGEKGTYTGSLSKSTGMPNGKGRLEYEKEGRWYEGDWIHGRWTGYGRLSNGDGDFYEGGLKNDHKHGKGTMRFADGRVFEGEYIRGQMIQGKMTYQDGSIYSGSWMDGMRHGRGKCVFVDGSEYEGEFREGNFHGHGKMTWNDGGWYVGEWCDGEMHGRGKEIRPDGSLRHDGEWSRGQPIRSARRRQQANHHPVDVN
eukprot:Nitzschia sp. Nitz4//scaffold99_size76975//14973//17249//NITZ4_005567-RA/size76975-processed-gene-0.24-mRNA-1//1//CDS//3329560823//7128//frame0